MEFALCAIVDGFNKKRKPLTANHISLGAAINSTYIDIMRQARIEEKS
jgi:hypothetical protein